VQNVLVVEDGKDHQLIIQKALKDGSSDIIFVDTVKSALSALSQQTFDLIVLDISLPDGHGFEVCSYLQANERLKSVPVIFLTANEDVSTKIAAFALGAEDYIVKPFNPAEFRARVDAKLRKILNSKGSEQTLTLGQISIHFTSQKAFLSVDEKAQELNLTPLEFKILAYLARNAERVLSREQILQAVWGPNVHVFDRTVDTHISSLRKKIAPCGHYIQAVLGSGYCFSVSAAPSKKTAS
jgi:DNA-binding response OmpR family regulator